MQLKYLEIYNSLEEVLEKSVIEAEDKTELEVMKEDLLKASQTLMRACELKLRDYQDLELKEIKDLSKVIMDMQNTYFGKPEVVVNNYQQNISNNQLNFFKSLMKDEI